MSELQTTTQQGAEQEPDTEEEFRALHVDATEGRARCLALADSAEKDGHPEIAAIYREMAETVLALIADMASSTAGALINVEDQLDAVADGQTGESTLLPEDAEKYLACFEQYLRLLDGLAGMVPAGSEGDQQRDLFDKLRRMTEGLVEFTKSISAEEEDEAAPGAEDDDDDEDEDE